MSLKRKNDVPLPESDEEEDYQEEGGSWIDDIYIPPPITAHCSEESKGPRLIIKKITNQNFKSYANTIEVGPFHHRFSAVIGPNGSGKSNVIDSMLFVFGYRANKIRSKKLSVLIHNSSQYPNLKSCSVSVHFQQIEDKPDGTCEFLPNTELVIGRTANKDNSSFYTINGKQKPIKDVLDLLQKHGIDLRHNRFLILQGEVEQIAMMEPKAKNDKDCGMLEYLEDIIGTTRYKTPLLKLSTRLDQLNETRAEKNNRCRTAEREVLDLELPMNAAITYMKLENSLIIEQNELMQTYVFDKKKEVAQLAVQKEVNDNELKIHDEKFAELQKERIEKETIIREELQKYQSLEEKFTEFNGLKEKAEKSRTEVQENMTASNNRRKELLKQVEKEKKNLEDCLNQPEKNKHEITESEAQVTKLSAEKEKSEAILAENLAQLEQHTKPIRDKKEPLESSLATIKASLDELKADYSLAEKEMDIIKKDETIEARKYESLKNQLEEVKNTLSDKKGTLDELTKSVPEMQGTLQGHKTKMQQLVQEEQTVSVELNKIKRKIDENATTMQQARSNNRVLNALMDQKAKGIIPGILGRLGDLGGIDKKYDVAISTCCGKLDFIVVDTADTGEACIQFLKQHNVGRGNFLALDKIQRHAQASRQKINTPDNVDRLFDLIRIEDERVRVAFYVALFDTLVTDDLTHGTKIAYGAKKWRVVTLVGEVIEMSGTMCGGGKTQARGKMGTSVTTKSAVNLNNSVSEKDLDAWRAQKETLQFRINDLQHQQSLLEENIKILTKLLQTKEVEITKLKYEVKSLADQLPRIEKNVNDQQKLAARTKSDPIKVKELEKKVSESKAQFQQKQKEVDKIQIKVDELTKQILDITNEKIKSVRQKVDKLVKQIDKLNTNISKLNVEIRNSERKAQKTEQIIANAEKEVEEAQNKIRQLGQERTQLQEDVEKLQAKVEEIRQQIDSASSGSSTIKKEIAAIQKLENEGKIKRLEIDERVKTMDKRIHDEKSKIPHWEKKLRSLKLQQIPTQPPPEPLVTFTDERLEQKKVADIMYKITTMEEELAKTKPNLSVIEEYNKKQVIYLERVKNLEVVTIKRNEVRDKFDLVKKNRYKEFSDGFSIISRKLKEMYQMITLGGDADLEHVDSMDPFSEGTRFAVRPPKKSWKYISNLSGGEKTLSSLALVFALHYYKPSPLYFMDEIDAALDFKNVSIVANYINERTKNAQFIIISLRANMFELADYLVGIYKTNDCTHSLTLQNSDKVAVVPSNKNANTQNIASPTQTDTTQTESKDPEPKNPEAMDTSDIFNQVRDGENKEN